MNETIKQKIINLFKPGQTKKEESTSLLTNGEESEDTPNPLQFFEILKSHVPLATSLLLSILSIFFFVVVTESNIFAGLSFYRTRWFALGILILSVSISYFGAILNNSIKSKSQSYIVFAHSVLLTLISFAYLIRLNNDGLQFFTYQANTSLVFVPLSILIFFVNLNIFSAKSYSQLLAVIQIFFVILFSFSIISFINVDSTFARNFNQGWLSVIFNWPAWIWLVISSIVITFISGRNIPHTDIERRILYLIGYYIMTLEVLLAIFILNLSYWYQSLLALVAWNFVYTNIYGLMTKKNDTKYRPRLIISVFYHIALFLLILYVGL